MICVILLITVFGLGVACGTVWSIKPDKDAEKKARLMWCHKHGLKLVEGVEDMAGGPYFWWGEDIIGNTYVPNKHGEPMLTKERMK